MRTAIVVFVVARAAAFVPAPPEVAALRLKETLDERGFVRVPGATSSAAWNSNLAGSSEKTMTTQVPRAAAVEGREGRGPAAH